MAVLRHEFLCASNPQYAWDEGSSHKGQGRDRQYVSDRQVQEIARGGELKTLSHQISRLILGDDRGSLRQVPEWELFRRCV